MAAASGDSSSYTVVARRYRPQAFGELIGQEHVAEALTGAIRTNRVGHAYLFTGARGVGKTSAARIFAKALNCEQGPTPTPCGECDVCLGVAAGSDVDVLEIDGASNRGIDEIRSLRQNISVRPSRARFKVYIIDEVHMLTREAFNALLKTLEEPPSHVKFVFCTTEAAKIPITILSRCQRFDFAGIEAGSIVGRLTSICEAESITAEPEALELLARRASGSMRDSQSLLEQVLSLGKDSISTGDVHQLLGTAADAHVSGLVDALLAGDAAAALGALDAATEQGVDAGQLLDQLLGWYRDLLAAAAGCSPSAMRFLPTAEAERRADDAQRLGVDLLAAGMQVIEDHLGKLRYSMHPRIIVEMALVRLCRLETLAALPELIQAAAAGASAPTAARAPTAAAPADPIKKKALTVDSGPRLAPPPASSPPRQPETRSEAQAAPATLTDASKEGVWNSALNQLHGQGMLADYLRRSTQRRVDSPHVLTVLFSAGDDLARSHCEAPTERERLERALSEAAGGVVRVQFAVDEAASTAKKAPVMSQRELIADLMKRPFAAQAAELFNAHAESAYAPRGDGE